MPIQSSDLFLVSSGGSKQCEAQNLNGKTGNVLVNRGGVSHKTGIENIPTTVLDDDLMLVNRGGASYKATGAEVQTLFPQGPAGGTDVIEDVVDSPVDGAWTVSTIPSSDAITDNWTAIVYAQDASNPNQSIKDGLFLVAAYGGNVRFMTSPDGTTWTLNPSTGNNQPWRGVAYGKGKFVAVANDGAGDSTGGNPGSARAAYSTDGVTWVDAPTASTDQKWRAVIYVKDANNPNTNVQNGVFVAVGENGKAMTSDDGITWVIGPNTTNQKWMGIAYGGGRFVAVGADNSKPTNVVYSTDGITWTNSRTADQNRWRGVAYGNGVFVATATTGDKRIAYSTDGGETWEQKEAPQKLIWNDVTYNGNKFVAVAGNETNPVMYSTDGINWTGAAAPNGTWEAVEYGKGKWVAVALNGSNQVMTSSTGTGEVGYTSDLTLASDKNLDTFTPGDGLQMVDSNGDTAAYVPITSAITAATPEILDGVWRSHEALPTAHAWTSIHFAKDENNINESVRRGIFVAFPYQFGAITIPPIYSYNGLDWFEGIKPNVGTTTPTASITYGNKRFVAVFEQGELGAMYSDDGIEWKMSDEGANAGWPTNITNWNGVTYGNGRFVAVSYNGLTGTATSHPMMVSDDGINWTKNKITGPIQIYLKDVQFVQDSNNPLLPAGGRFFAIGDNASRQGGFTHDVVYSDNGLNWEKAPEWPPYVDVALNTVYGKFAYGNGTFVVTKNNHTKFYRSNSGISDWIEIPVPQPSGNNGKYSSGDIIYGDNGFVVISEKEFLPNMHSYDGINWEVFTSPQKAGSSVTYGDNKYVAVSRDTTSGTTEAISWTYTGGPDEDVTTLALTPTSKDLKYFNPGDTVTEAANSGTIRMVGTDELMLNDTSGDWTTSVGKGAEVDKSLSGTGTYGSHTGNVMTVNNSNAEWVANDNQRGENYYATTQTTRLSLAKALSIDDYGVMTASARQWAATAVAGYYPLYRFERIAKLVGDGTAHSHTFDGVTWYMPNGVTYYHGDYSGY